MKLGSTVQELSTEITRQSQEKEDLLAPCSRIAFNRNDQTLDVAGSGSLLQHTAFDASDHCHSQIAAFTGIGAKYYNKVREDDWLLFRSNVNHWMQHESNKDKRRMVRTLDGKARAFMSDSYLRIDNDLVFQHASNALAQIDDIEIASCEVTEQKLYIKAFFPKVEGEVKVGDVVRSGVMIRNSEIGQGSFEVLPMMYRLWCLNGATHQINTGHKMRRSHRGARIQDDAIVYSQEAIEAKAKAALLACRDAINTYTGHEYFDSVLDTMREGAQSEKAEKPEDTVEKLAKTFSLNESEQSGVLERFIRDQDYSKYGAMNAVTNLANTAQSYDRASELEVIGGRIIELPANDWHNLAKAA